MAFLLWKLRFQCRVGLWISSIRRARGEQEKWDGIVNSLMGLEYFFREWHKQERRLKRYVLFYSPPERWEVLSDEYLLCFLSNFCLWVTHMCVILWLQWYRCVGFFCNLQSLLWQMLKKCSRCDQNNILMIRKVI